MTARFITNTIWVRPKSKLPYPIYFGQYARQELGALCQERGFGRSVAIISHDSIADIYAEELITSLRDHGFDTHLWTLPEGESTKSLAHVSDILDKLVANRFERIDTVVALGGGVIGDLVGFAAAIYLRGIHVIQIPTTLLSQVDSAIGGKTGVNHSEGKNLIGSFYQPDFLLVDPTFLRTLPEREWRCGMAEIVKYGVICEPKMFALIAQNTGQLHHYSFDLCPTLWERLILTSCKAKARVVSRDERESGLREILNFGHTIGHAIESLFSYNEYLHGEAVALGMIGAGAIAVSQGYWTAESQSALVDVIRQLGFSTTVKPCDAKALVSKMYLDKKVRRGQIRWVLPTSIGTVTHVNTISDDMVCDALFSTLLSKGPL